MSTTGIPARALKAHLAINVRDVERSVAFYTKMFGIEASKVRPGYAKFDVANPPLNFTLNQVRFGERGALSHLGIQVGSADDVLAVRDRWVKEGLATEDETNVNCCYAIQDKTWVHDPDGNSWEVFVVHEDNLPASPECSCATDAANEAGAGAACCPTEPVTIAR
jgi:catechol 2,3-dioxygenase-like lactoylglutathione lyase family enzyme